MSLRILFATDHIHFPQGGGGAERNTHELTMALRDRGFEAAVLSSFSPDMSWLSVTNRLRRALPPRREFPRDSLCGYHVYRGWNMNRIEEVVSRFKPDVIVVQSTRPDPMLHALRPCGVPLVVYLHEVDDIDHLRTLAGKNLTLLANSNFTARRLWDQCGLDCQVVLPLIDPQYYTTQTRRQSVLFVNTARRKGLETAFTLAERRPDIPFDFVLSWILNREQIARLAARARKAGNIVLHPPTDDMRSMYANTRILLVPSKWEETWGRVATEAHISGIPVLGSEIGGLTQAIGSGGLLVPPEAPIEQWLASLSRLWDDPQSYADFAQAACEYSKRSEIQPSTIVTRLVGILKDAIASGNRTGKVPAVGPAMISVILATHNGADTIERTLAAMSELDAPAGGWKLLVVNNASTDDTEARVLKWQDRLPLEYLTEPRLGKSKAINTALGHAEGDLFVMTDDDVLPDRNWLTEWRRVADAFPQCSIFGGTIVPEFGDSAASDIPEWCFGVLYGASPRFAEGELHPMPGTALYDISGANMAIRKSVHDQGGRFDENFLVGLNGLMGEDTEFVRQRGAQGHRIGFAPGARIRHIIHKHQTSRRWIHHRFFRHGRTMFLMANLQKAPRFPWRSLHGATGSAIRLLLTLGRNDRDGAFKQSRALAYDLGAIRQALASFGRPR